MTIRTASVLASLLVTASATAQQLPAKAPLGSLPPPGAFPTVEFAFEARITLSPAVVVGETAMGRRQYIPITGGTVTGPKFKGEVIPGGWDYQLSTTGGCQTLRADYFWRAEDGTVIHILNQALNCPGELAEAGRNYVRPQFEAPKGKHEWMTRASFVATLELDSSTPATPGTPPRLDAIRIRFFQIK
jgi:hypothetical protein